MVANTMDWPQTMQFWLRTIYKNKKVVTNELVVEEEEDFTNSEECEN